MSQSLAAATPRRHLLPSEIGGSRTAKAELPDLRIAENRDYRAVSGQCLDKARLALGWNLDELADHLGRRDPRQIARWISGAERVQLDAVIAVAPLLDAFVIALASLSPRIETVTEIRVRRFA
jgi:hypothetical protein